MQFLIIEDEAVSRRILHKTLEKYGRCDEAANGLLALELFTKALHSKAGYDLVTLDITLHEMNGLDVLLMLREMEEAHRIPPPRRTKVIVVTSHSDKDHVNACLTAGCNGYIIKPIDPRIVLQSVKAALLKYVNDFF
jgi:two-component system chemotaxis response regulator CheY